MRPCKQIWAETALTSEGWQDKVEITINSVGRILSVDSGKAPRGERHMAILPAPVNLHSHAFQRAMAGLAEVRLKGIADDFWGWRQLMYRFLEKLSPGDVEVIAALVQVEMLEAGFGSVVEFHYLHNNVDGSLYADPAEMLVRIAAAADTSGIGLTLLPVLYEQAGCDGRELTGPQKRFHADQDLYARLCVGAGHVVKDLPADCAYGTAVHSLRAASPASVSEVEQWVPDRPFHLHVAEQPAEVREVEAAYGATPVAWLLANLEISSRWCLIHCTQMTPKETIDLARSGAVAGLCPITESNLGDGVFDGARYLAMDGCLGVGSDSNIRISQCEEYRTLEYSQRLQGLSRCVLSSGHESVGRQIFECSCAGGSKAAGRDCGTIKPGSWADLMELDTSDICLQGLEGDNLLDAWIFAASDRVVHNVWSAGRHLVQDGKHINRAAVETKFRELRWKLGRAT